MTSNHGNTPRSSGDVDGPTPAHPLSRATYVLGSVLSVGLVIGLGVWGYKLLVRDVSGVPVIRAAEGPIRVQPEDPGGRQALNQGLAVNDVAALGTASEAPDELILAPAPLDLSDEDAPGTMAAATGGADARDADAAPEVPGAVAATDAQSVEMANKTDAPETDENAKMLALAEAVSDGIAPLEALPDAPETGRADAQPEDMAETEGTPEPAVAASLRPKMRPADLSNIREVAARDPEAQATRDVDPDSIPVGTRLAQLGAFSSAEIAREEWTRLDGRFQEYLAGKDRVIQRATSGGRTFYRLRAMGFDDLADARRFCSALVSEKAECIPVVTR